MTGLSIEHMPPAANALTDVAMRGHNACAHGRTQEELDDVDRVASSMAEQVKEHLAEQLRALKGGSKFAQSRVASQATALQAAAHNNQYELVAKLLLNGADPDARNPSGMTPLHAAADGGFKDVVDILLVHNATIDAPGPNEATPLHLAAHKGRASVSELLLREGAAVDASANGFSVRHAPSVISHQSSVIRHQS